jgi:hypothetical protein
MIHITIVYLSVERGGVGQFEIHILQRLNRLLKNSWSAPQPPSAAKAVAENKPVIAAVSRCATQKQEQNRVFQRNCEAAIDFSGSCGTAGSRALSKTISN